MTPEERAAYDAYPLNLQRLTAACRLIAALPLEAMVKVTERLEFTGTLLGADGGQPVDPAVARRDRQLLRTAAAFRNLVTQIAEGNFVGDDQPAADTGGGAPDPTGPAAPTVPLHP